MIRTLKLHNFGKIKDLEINCANKNVYIVGQNGSGKTTILQAISLALTGKVAKGLTNDLFIGPYDKDFTVVLELDDGTKIGRTAKGAKLQLPNGAIFKKVKDVYEHLGFDPALLFNLSYVRQGEIADLFMSGNGKGVIDKLSSLIIDAKRMSEGNLELGRKIKTLESDIAAIQNGMKQNLDFVKEFNIDEIEHNITTYSTMIKTLLESKKYSSSDINKFYNMYSQFDILSYNLITQKKEANYYKDLFSKLTKPEITVIELKDKQTEYKEYAIEFAKINDIDNEIARYRVVENYADDVEKYISTKFYRVDYTEDDLMRINAAENDMMDCLSTTKHFNDVTLAEEFLKNYNSMDHVDAKTLLENKKLKDYLVNRLKPFRFEVQYIRSIKANNPEMHSRDIILNHVTELEKDKLNIINKYRNPPQEVTDKEIWDIDQKWKTYNDTEYQMTKSIAMCNDTYKKYTELADKIKDIPTKEQLDEMKDIEKNIAQYEDMLQVWEDKKSMYNKCILNQKTREKQIKDTEEEMEKVSYWKDIFSDTPNRLRAVLFNPVVEVLNKEFYELFSFSGLGEINIDWNKVTITIGEKKFEQLSGAQMVAVGLSLRLALLKVMGECVPIMLVDEPTTFLDDDRKNDIQKLLNHMSTVSQCIVSTHDDNIISANSVVINLNK